MQATYACAYGVRGEAKIDHLSSKMRVRGSMLFFALSPERVRFDLVSPFGATVATLTSDGNQFSLLDLREKRFFRGPSSPCNIARFTNVPIPGHALVSLLHGEAPVLVHDPSQLSLRWSNAGYYVVEIGSKQQAREVIHLAPMPLDWQKPWNQQRIRVLDVRVWQQSYELYHAELGDHRAATTAPPLVDENNLEPPILPSGPACTAELPRRIHVKVPLSDDDMLFRYQQAYFNPPVPDGTFSQPVPGGIQVIPAGPCDG